MAQNTDFLLVAEPQQIAYNQDSEAKSYVLTNTSTAPAEILGQGEALGEGTPLVGGAQTSFELGYEESFYAAAPDADEVTIRVLEYKSL